MPVTPGSTPTEVNLGNAPAAPAGSILGVWQAGAPYPDPNNPEALVRDASVYVDGRIQLVSAVGGKPAAGQLVMIYTAAVAMTLPANFTAPNSYGTLSANPTATALYAIYKATTLIGTVSISTGGAFTFATVGGVAVPLAPGDRLTMVAPGAQDATLADVGITLVGQRS
jgi:hypothetical protein